MHLTPGPQVINWFIFWWDIWGFQGSRRKHIKHLNWNKFQCHRTIKLEQNLNNFNKLSVSFFCGTQKSLDEEFEVFGVPNFRFQIRESFKTEKYSLRAISHYYSQVAQNFLESRSLVTTGLDVNVVCIKWNAFYSFCFPVLEKPW